VPYLLPESLRERLVRRARVHLSFVRVLLPQFWFSIALFLTVTSLGALVIWHESDPRLTAPHALYAALTLTFFEISESYPEKGGVLIQVVYFALPAGASRSSSRGPSASCASRWPARPRGARACPRTWRSSRATRRSPRSS
jgi:hypothetical protein